MLVLGAGGAARAAAFALRKEGAAVTILARDAEKAAEAARAIGCDYGPLASAPERRFDAAVNATPLGGGALAAETPLPAAAWHAGAVAFDMVYDPLETRFLREARAAGAATVSGLEMLLHQAVGQFEAWTGHEGAPRGDAAGAGRREGRRVSRYSRQERFSGIGPEGQDRLRRARVLVVGVGALGSCARRDDGARRRRVPDRRRPRLRGGVEPAAAVAVRRVGRGLWPAQGGRGRSPAPSPQLRGRGAGPGGRRVGRQRARARGRRRPRPRRHRQLRRTLPPERRLPGGLRPLGVRRLRGRPRPRPGRAAARDPLPALRPARAPGPGQRRDLRHGGRHRPHRARGGRDPGRGSAQAAGGPRGRSPGRPRDRGPLVRPLRRDGPAGREALLPGLSRGAIRGAAGDPFGKRCPVRPRRGAAAGPGDGARPARPGRPPARTWAG